MKESQHFINFGIVGLGKTGIATYTFLKKLGRNVICYDDSVNASVDTGFNVSAN